MLQDLDKITQQTLQLIQINENYRHENTQLRETITDNNDEIQRLRASLEAVRNRTALLLERLPSLDSDTSELEQTPSSDESLS